MLCKPMRSLAITYGPGALVPLPGESSSMCAPELSLLRFKSAVNSRPGITKVYFLNSEIDSSDCNDWIDEDY